MRPDWIGLITAVIAAIIALASQIMLFKFRSQAEKELEHLRIQFRQFEEIDKLKKRYSLPLLKSAEELYNKINDVVRNRQRVLHYFEKLPGHIADTRSLGDVLSSPKAIYLANVVYLFARYFASVEAIKKDVGLLQLESDEGTRALQLRLRQTMAVFFSRRLHNNFKIREADELKYEGCVLEGAQVLIGEAMLKGQTGSYECISFYEFCQKLAIEDGFRQCMSPLLGFLEDMEEIFDLDSKMTGIDFRWAKLILFASSLRSLVKQIDSRNVIVLLPELEQYEQEHLATDEELQRNIKYFKTAYPDP